MVGDILISAVIPTYNRERLIGRAIESALNQSHPPKEVIVVDDGSIDRSREIVQSYGRKVRYIFQENSGASEARNCGVRVADSEWVAFLDSDDYWVNNHLEQIAGAIKNTDGKAKLYFSNIQRTSTEGLKKLWELSGFDIEGDYELTNDATDWVILSPQPMMLQSSAFHRRTYLEIDGLRKDLMLRHDTHFFYKICIARPACAVRNCGTIMTSDVQNKRRLTARYHPKTIQYCNETCLIYEDILCGNYDLSIFHKKQLNKRYSSAHIQFAKLLWIKKKRKQAFIQLLRATLKSPLRIKEGVDRVFGRMLKKLIELNQNRFKK